MYIICVIGINILHLIDFTGRGIIRVLNMYIVFGFCVSSFNVFKIFHRIYI